MLSKTQISSKMYARDIKIFLKKKKQKTKKGINILLKKEK